jgi:hypothetical protein
VPEATPSGLCDVPICLQREEPGVLVACSDQLVVRAELGDATVDQHRDHVGVADRVHSVRDQQAGAPRAVPAQIGMQPVLRFRVESGTWARRG